MRPHRTLAWLTPLTLVLALFAASTTAHALVINPTYASSITSNANASQIEGAIVSAIAQVEGLYSNNVVLNYNFTYTNLGNNGIL